MTLRLSQTEAGTLIHSPVRYDVLLWLRSLGRERSLRRQLVALASVAAGDRVLDVGCGTGTLAIAAKRWAGAGSTVHGVDASPEMVAQARAKARRAHVDVAFEIATAQNLPFPDAAFDVVLNTLVLHQLPHAGVHEAAKEIGRVLRPGGRLLVVDIDPRGSDNPGRTPHSGSDFNAKLIVPLLRRSGLEVLESGPVAFRLRRFERLQYVLATT